MNRDILNTIILCASFLALFGVAEVLYHALKVKAELTRKIVHIGTGLITLLFPVMLGNHWLVLLLCASFALILILSLKYNFLQSINAIDRQSVGSLAYPVSVYGCYLAYDYFQQDHLYFYLPIVIMAICDPIAALVGKKWPIGKYKAGKENKTLMGSIMFFVGALIIAMIFLTPGFGLAKAAIMGVSIGLVSSITEALSKKGFDNLTIPASVLFGFIIIQHLLEWN